MKKSILITGASRGIGFETAKILAEKSCSVIAVSRSKAKLESLASLSKNIHILAADITKSDAVTQIKDFLSDNDIQLNGIIQNAGILINKPFRDLSDADWNRLLDINLLAPVRLTRELFSFLYKGSHIVHISSMGGFQGSDKFPGLSGYSTSKGALSVLTECLAVEFSSDEIFVNALCLGAVQTEMLSHAFPGYKAPVTSAEMGEYIADFVLNGHKYFNGKILPIALNNPD